ncbi:Uncharacterised protein [Candidatus Tiddalikarchaeum anstoanum]|nr:Uncharacterised protein [Candidatus Tiddalikarchaeum anstoanum]
MTENLKSLNTKYNEMVDELFEELLCDKCMKTIKVGNADGKLVNMLNNETLFLCKKCNEEVRNLIKKS